MRIRANFIAFKTILIKEMLRFLRIWIQTILPAAITMSLYFVIFGKLIGSQIDPIDGFSQIGRAQDVPDKRRHKPGTRRATLRFCPTYC